MSDKHSVKLDGSLTARRAKSYELFFLGMSAVVGSIYSWNHRFDGNFIMLVAATIVTGVGYLCYYMCWSEMLSLLPFAGGAYGFARITFGPYIGYVIGTFESIQFVLLTASTIIPLGEVIANLVQNDPNPTHLPLYWLGLYLAILIPHFLTARLYWWWVLLCGLTSLVFIAMYLFSSAIMNQFDFYEFALQQEVEVGGSADFVRSVSHTTWFFVGIEVLSFTCTSTKEPKKSVPRAILRCFTTQFFLVLCVLFICCSQAPGSELFIVDYDSSSSSAIDVEEIYRDTPLSFGYSKALGVSLKIAATLSIPVYYIRATTMLYAMSKQLSAMAKSQLYPTALAYTTKSEVPVVALVLGCLLGYLALLAVWFGGGYKQGLLLNISILAQYLVAISVMIGFVIFRRKYSNLERKYQSVLGYSGAVLGVVLFVLSIVSLVYYNDEDHYVVVAFAVAVLALSMYYCCVSKSHQFYSPEEQAVLLVAYVIKANRQKSLRNKHNKSFTQRDSDRLTTISTTISQSITNKTDMLKRTLSVGNLNERLMTPRRKKIRDLLRHNSSNTNTHPKTQLLSPDSDNETSLPRTNTSNSNNFAPRTFTSFFRMHSATKRNRSSSSDEQQRVHNLRSRDLDELVLVPRSNTNSSTPVSQDNKNLYFDSSSDVNDTRSNANYYSTEFPIPEEKEDFYLNDNNDSNNKNNNTTTTQSTLDILDGLHTDKILTSDEFAATLDLNQRLPNNVILKPIAEHRPESSVVVSNTVSEVVTVDQAAVNTATNTTNNTNTNTDSANEVDEIDYEQIYKTAKLFTDNAAIKHSYKQSQHKPNTSSFFFHNLPHRRGSDAISGNNYPSIQRIRPTSLEHSNDPSPSTGNRTTRSLSSIRYSFSAISLEFSTNVSRILPMDILNDDELVEYAGALMASVDHENMPAVSRTPSASSKSRRNSRNIGLIARVFSNDSNHSSKSRERRKLAHNTGSNSKSQKKISKSKSRSRDKLHNNLSRHDSPKHSPGRSDREISIRVETDESSIPDLASPAKKKKSRHKHRHRKELTFDIENQNHNDRNNDSINNNNINNSSVDSDISRIANQPPSMLLDLGGYNAYRDEMQKLDT